MLQIAEERPIINNVDGLFSVSSPGEVRRLKSWLDSRLKAARALRSDDLISEIKTYTPAEAEYILAEFNGGNRPLSKKRVAALAESIRDGRWLVTSQGISFSRDGLLNDGQHRLAAIVAAGRPIKLTTTFEEDREVFQVLDTGRARSAADVLSIDHVPNATSVAGAARILWLIERNDASLHGGPSATVTNGVVREVVKAHPRIIEAGTTGHRVATRLKTSASAATAAFCLILEKSRFTADLGDSADRLVDGASLPPRSALLTLREGLINRALEGPFKSSTPRTIFVAASVILAWNSFVRGRRRPSIKWDHKTSFPQPE